MEQNYTPKDLIFYIQLTVLYILTGNTYSRIIMSGLISSRSLSKAVRGMF